MKNSMTSFAKDTAGWRSFSVNRVFALALVLCGVLVVASGVVKGSGLFDFQSPSAQDAFPPPPADRTLIYVADENNSLVALPFETGTTPLAVGKVAGSDKRSYVELKGESAATVVKSNEPRFYLFVPDAPGTHPPFIVSLTAKRGARRVTAMAQKGFKGYAIDSAEIIKPHYRVLGHEGGLFYMEIRPREMLLPGEYAIIGADLRRIATFRIAAANAS